MRVGSELKAARKKAGITVEVLSKRTKVKVSKLVALEKGDFKDLPTGLYLFSMVRAYAREVRIDPEPIVERLRVDFADKDTFDALNALNATGALDVKTSAKAGGSREERSSLFRNAAIAAGVILAVVAGAGAYLYGMGRTPQQNLTPRVIPSSPAPTANTVTEIAPTPAAEPASPAPPANIAVPLQPSDSAEHSSATAKRHRANPRTPAAKPPRELVANVGAVSDALGLSGVKLQIESSPTRSDGPVERTGTIDELRLDGPALAAAP